MSEDTLQRPAAPRTGGDRPLRVLRGLAAPIGLVLVGAAGVAYLGAVDPNEAGHYPTCPFLELTGLYCPGCGSLRALHALAHGDVGTALARNPLMVASLPLLAFVWLAWVRRAVTGRSREWAAPPSAVWTLLAVVIAFAVLRNLPGFTWLAP